jgi:hypothetical protein
MYSPLLRNLARRLSQVSQHGRRRARPLRIARFCPRLEGLEERALPEAVTFTQSMGGAWEDPNNWTDENGIHRTPDSLQDDAHIPDLDPGASVTVTSIAGCGTLHTDESGKLVIDGGTLVLNPGIPSQLDGPIELNGGVLWLGSGTMALG